jgi:hypothetical protein
MAKVNIVFDASQFDMFRLCEQRFNLRYNLNKSLPTKSMQLDRGTLVHIACEIYYQCLKDGARYDYAVNAALVKVKEAGVIETDLDNDMINRVLEVMEEYFEYWRVADQSFEINHVENPFIYLLYEDDEIKIHMAGKIDLLFTDNKYTNCPLDHKSYDRTSEVERMSNQFKNYCYATESNILIVNRIGFQKTLKPHEKFKRIPLSYDPLILTAWKSNVVKVIRDNYLQCVATNEWPLNETSCYKYNRKCEYHAICDSSGEEAKLYKLATDYVDIEAWDVTKVLRKSSAVLEDKVKNE